MELRHLRYAVAVADEGGFSAAARKCAVAQPALSRQVRALERELGVELFVRGPQAVRLTAPGALFIERARQALQAADEAAEIARRAANGDAGELHVGFVAPVYEVLPALIAAFRRERPGVALRLTRATTAEMVALLMDESLDAAFLANPVPMGGLLGHEVMSFRLCAALPAGHPLAAAPHVSLAALKAERWVLLSGLSVGLSAFVIRACRAAGYYPAIAEQAGEVATLIALVSAREGVTLVPIGPESVETDGVRYVPLAEDLLLPISLTWAAAAVSPARDAFVALTRRTLRPERG